MIKPEQSPSMEFDKQAGFFEYRGILYNARLIRQIIKPKFYERNIKPIDIVRSREPSVFKNYMAVVLFHEKSGVEPIFVKTKHSITMHFNKDCLLPEQKLYNSRPKDVEEFQGYCKEVDQEFKELLDSITGALRK